MSFGGAHKTARAIPEDLLKEASRRLEVMALLAAVLWAVASVLWHIGLGSTANGFGLSPYTPSDNIAVVAVIASFGLYYYAGHTRREPQFILNLGLAYMVLTAAALGIITHWWDTPVDPHTKIQPTISWIGVVILMFAAVVPSSTRKTVTAGLIAASMGPIGMFISKARGIWDFGPWINAFLMHYPDYLLVGVALVIARVVTRLGQQVSKDLFEAA